MLLPSSTGRGGFIKRGKGVGGSPARATRYGSKGLWVVRLGLTGERSKAMGVRVCGGEDEGGSGEIWREVGGGGTPLLLLFLPINYMSFPPKTIWWNVNYKF